jgi:hypothetical protein
MDSIGQAAGNCFVGPLVRIDPSCQRMIEQICCRSWRKRGRSLLPLSLYDSIRAPVQTSAIAAGKQFRLKYRWMDPHIGVCKFLLPGSTSCERHVLDTQSVSQKVIRHTCRLPNGSRNAGRIR